MSVQRKRLIALTIGATLCAAAVVVSVIAVLSGERVYAWLNLLFGGMLVCGLGALDAARRLIWQKGARNV
jgi:hypothetical protein